MDDLFTNTMAIELENKFPPNIGIRMPLLHEVQKVVDEFILMFYFYFCLNFKGNKLYVNQEYEI